MSNVKLILFTVTLLSVDRSRFLKVIRQLESSGGKNLHHAAIQSGANEGQYAAGQFGLVPSTLQYVVKQAKNQTVPVDPEVNSLINREPADITSKLNSNPELDEKAANLAAEMFLRRAKGVETTAAYMWNQGQNVKNIDFNHPYVQKFIQEEQNQQNSEPVNSRFKQLRKYLGDL